MNWTQVMKRLEAISLKLQHPRGYWEERDGNCACRECQAWGLVRALIAEVKAVETAEMTFWRFGDLGDSLGELLQRMCSKEGFLQHYPGAQEEVHVLITRGKEREHGRE